MSQTVRSSRPSFAPSLGAAALAAVLLAAAAPAHAYVGPGAGLTAIGTVVAVIGAILLALVGFVWYPIKRMMRRKAAAPVAAPGADGASGPAGDERP